MMLKTSFSLFTACLLFVHIGFVALADDSKNMYLKQLFVRNGDTLPYRILFPENYDPKKEYPLVVFLHGSGERGNNNESQLKHGGSLFLADSNRQTYPAIVVFPQCSKSGFWSNMTEAKDTVKKTRVFNFKTDGPPTKDMALLMELVKWLPAQHKINESQNCMMGLSMGGMGTLEIIRRMPGTFKRAVSICGGANPATAKELGKTKIWLTHGMKDEVVLPEYSIKMAEALRAEKMQVELTLFPEANHNSWDATFRLPNLLPWLFAKK